MSACLLCGHDLASAPVINTVARNGYPQRSVACGHCRFVQVDPMPSAAEVRAYYESGDYRREFPPLPVMGVEPGSEQYEAARDAQAEDGARFILEAVGGMAGKRAYEVGCGDGRVASAIARADTSIDVGAWDEDPNQRALAESRGIETQPPVEMWQYDLVYALQVLEHVVDPVATLRHWRGLLTDGSSTLAHASPGKLHVQTPTLERIYGGPSHFFQRPHLVQFTCRTLAAALLMTGFRDVEIGISGSVLFATATVDPQTPSRTYEEAAEHLGPVDDVDALMERGRVFAVAPDSPGVLIQRWMGGVPIAELGPDAEAKLRSEFGLVSSILSETLDSLHALSFGAEERVRRMDTAHSNDPHVQGYNAGCAATWQRAQQAIAHLANHIKARGSV